MPRLFLPAGTNYCTDPSFEVDANADGLSDAWTASGSAGVSPILTRVAGITGTGTKAQRFQYAGTAGQAGLFYRLTHQTAAASFVAGEVATASLYVRSDVSGCSPLLRISAYDAANALLGSSVDRAISGSVSATRYSVSYSLLPANTDYVQVQVRVNLIDEGDTLDLTIDDVLIEKSPILTPYFDGSSTDSLNANTYAWTGAANASTSTRAVSFLDWAASANAYNSGTIAMRFSPLWAGNNGGYHFIFGVASGTSLSDGTYEVVISKDGANKVVTSLNSGDSVSALSAAQSFAIGTTNSVISRWTQGGSGTLDQTLNGTAAAQVAQTKTLATGTRFGVQMWPTYPAAAHLGPIIISPTRKSDAWTTAMDAILRSASPDLTVIKRDLMAPGDALFTGLEVNGSHLYVKGS